ncbi:linear amide C-N hydrolase [Vagococcus bubulae]|uniref:Linear amide C-N hydrolase n=1 Tax=Vagococcus bubulae TaxID=1977868 RepID=A0A429ZHB3_9ENTE|nr:linear amide C-N hydrolase [Vagococcus bubulae]RST93108.1 linear amide C-N hydrolase [Vagococcus bubulae]
MCTNIKLSAKNGDIFFGRTMDLDISMFGEDSGLDLDITLATVPKNINIASQVSPWTSKYTVLGVMTKYTTVMYDGINEHGLTGDMQVLVEATTKNTQDILNENKKPLLTEEFVLYILSNFKTVSEIKEHYQEFVLADEPFVYKKQNLHFPLHYTFVDTTGKGIVLEPVLNGGFKIYDYVDVMTNSPEYSYHTTNIRHYINLSDIDHPTHRVMKNNVDIEPIEHGTGYGLFGMPGDYTSPSRFIRSFYLRNMIDEFDSNDGLNRLYSIFRPLIVPRGLEHKKAEMTITDYTRYWSGYDVAKQTAYVQTGEGLAITAKTLDSNLTDITYHAIHLDNNVVFAS